MSIARITNSMQKIEMNFFVRRKRKYKFIQKNTNKNAYIVKSNARYRYEILYCIISFLDFYFIFFSLILSHSYKYEIYLQSLRLLAVDSETIFVSFFRSLFAVQRNFLFSEMTNHPPLKHFSHFNFKLNPANYFSFFEMEISTDY